MRTASMMTSEELKTHATPKCGAQAGAANNGPSKLVGSGSSGSQSVDSALRELHGATEELMQIVEGFHGERWTANGKRLVDTPEWCRFYVARCAVNRAQENI